MAMSTGAWWGGHFCVEPGIFVLKRAFCVEPCIFLSNWAFLCQTSVIITYSAHGWLTGTLGICVIADCQWSDPIRYVKLVDTHHNKQDKEIYLASTVIHDSRNLSWVIRKTHGTTEFSKISIRVRLWINTDIHGNRWDVITHPCLTTVKLEHGWVITYHIKLDVITYPYPNLSQSMSVKRILDIAITAKLRGVLVGVCFRHFYQTGSVCNRKCWARIKHVHKSFRFSMWSLRFTGLLAHPMYKYSLGRWVYEPACQDAAILALATLWTAWLKANKLPHICN